MFINVVQSYWPIWQTCHTPPTVLSFYPIWNSSAQIQFSPSSVAEVSLRPSSVAAASHSAMVVLCTQVTSVLWTSVAVVPETKDSNHCFNNIYITSNIYYLYLHCLHCTVRPPLASSHVPSCNLYCQLYPTRLGHSCWASEPDLAKPKFWPLKSNNIF